MTLKPRYLPPDLPIYDRELMGPYLLSELAHRETFIFPVFPDILRQSVWVLGIRMVVV